MSQLWADFNEKASQAKQNAGTITNKVVKSNAKASQAITHVSTILDKVADSNESTHQAIINLGIILDKVADPNEDARQAKTTLNTILGKVANSNANTRQAITHLGTILEVPDENIIQAKKKSGAIWDKLTKWSTLWYHLADPKLMPNDRLINGAYNATLLAFYLCYTVFGDRRRLWGSMTACSVMAGVNYWLILRYYMQAEIWHLSVY